jgi:hypothetical protein
LTYAFAAVAYLAVCYLVPPRNRSPPYEAFEQMAQRADRDERDALDERASEASIVEVNVEAKSPADKKGGGK